jgi:Tfp pilus assembly protein PilW
VNDRGFTLAEILVTTTFAVLFGALVFSFSQSAFRAARAQQALSEAQDTAHLALSLLSRDLRQAGFTPGGAPLLGLARAENGAVALRCDLNGDGDTGDSGESVSWQESPTRGTLTRASGAASPQPVADHLSIGSLRFDYVDADGARLEPGEHGLSADERWRVRRVDVTFELAVPHLLAPVRVRVEASVEMRNGAL